MILCIGATPAVQRVMVFPRLKLDAVNRAATTMEGVAGKAVNVAKVLKVLGEEPLATGFLGGDRGAQIRAALDAQAVAQDFLEVTAPTRECITIIDQGSGTITELVEESRPVSPEDYARLQAVIRRRLPQCRALILSGSITPDGPTGFYAECVRLGRAAGCLTVADAQGPLLLGCLAARPGLVKPNRTELAASLGQSISDEKTLLKLMRDLHERGAERMVVTDGKRATVAFDGRLFWRIWPPSVQAVNPIGSGDACAAGIVSRLVHGEDLGEACRWGMAAGAANALTAMAGEVRREDVERLQAAVRLELIEP